MFRIQKWEALQKRYNDAANTIVIDQEPSQPRHHYQKLQNNRNHTHTTSLHSPWEWIHRRTRTFPPMDKTSSSSDPLLLNSQKQVLALSTTTQEDTVNHPKKDEDSAVRERALLVRYPFLQQINDFVTRHDDDVRLEDLIAR